MHRPRRPSHAAPRTSWEHVSGWYADYLDRPGTLQSEVVFPGALKLLEPKDGEKILEIACGEGAFSRLILKRANVSLVGFDAAPSLIARARKAAPRGAEYLVADAADFLKRLPAHGFDAAACILAIQNIKPFAQVFAQAAKALKPGGRFVVVMNHPSFRAPRQSGWGWDEGRKLQYRRVDAYLSELEVPIQAHPGSAPEMKTFSYHRPLQAYVKALAASGFTVTDLEEWISHKSSELGAKAKAENAARREIPMFLALVARKN